jgi:glycosyltransferase involved in cell wall biosynthesis
MQSPTLPFATLIIVTYQRLTLLKECLESIDCATQPFPIETIIVVNGDDEETFQYLQNQSLKGSIFKITQANPSDARNYAIRHSRGEMLFFLDDDCCLPPDYFSVFFDFYRDNNDGDVYGGPDSDFPNATARERAIGLTLTSPLATFKTKYRHTSPHQSLPWPPDEKNFILCNLCFRASIFRNEHYHFNSILHRNEENYLLFQIRHKKMYYVKNFLVFHHRKTRLHALIKSIILSGFYRAKCFWLDRRSTPFIYTIPSLFLAYIIALPFLSFSNRFFILPWIAYWCANIYFSIRTCLLSREFKFIPAVVAYQFLINCCYGAGFWAGFFSFGSSGKSLNILPNNLPTHQPRLDKKYFDFGLVIYNVIFKTTKFILQSRHDVQIWTRNSLYFNNIVFGISDIDFTFFSDRPLPSKNLTKIFSDFSLLKKIFLVLGEINYFDSTKTDFLKRHANFYELQRDPILISKLNSYTPDTPNLTDKFVFLARMLCADIRNLFLQPQKRIKKWNIHFQQLGLERWHGTLSWDTFLACLQSSLFYLFPGYRFFEFLRIYVPLHLKGASDDDFLSKYPHLENEFILLFTPRWRGLLRKNFNYGKETEILLTLDSLGREILFKQLLWEICWLPSLEMDSLDTRETQEHLNRVLMLLRVVHPASEVALSTDLNTYFFPLAKHAPTSFLPGQSSTFCVLPWSHFFINPQGHYGLCELSTACWPSEKEENPSLQKFWQGNIMQDIRQQILKGKPSSYCTKCYADEKKGLKSFRQLKNEEFDQYHSYQDLEKHSIKSMVISLGRECDLQCLKCNSRFSSSWDKTLSNFKPNLARPSRSLNKDSPWYKNSGLRKDVPYALEHLEKLMLTGGEPFLSPDHQLFLGDCIATQRTKHVLLIYQTNGLTDPRPFVQLWEQFKGVLLLISLEGIEKQHEYLRYPSCWAKLLNNLKIIDALPSWVNVVIRFDAHILNTLYLPSLCEWLMNNSFKKIANHPTAPLIDLKILADSELLTINKYDSGLREHIYNALYSWYKQSTIPWPQLEVLMKLLRTPSQNDFSPFLTNILKILDKQRGLDFYHTFPELSDFFKSQSDESISL